MKRIIIDSAENLLRAAATDDRTLIEFIVEDRRKPSVVGNIYVGIVENILPSRFAFINIGEEKNAFLYLNDPKESTLEVKNGMQILVQAFKDATAIKGPAVTSCLSFTGKYMVLIKNNFAKEEIGVSKKIENPSERERLKKTAHQLLQKGYGLIIRTAAEGVEDSELAEEYAALSEICLRITSHGQYTKAPAVMLREESISVKAVKELMTRDVKEIVVNDKNCYQEICDYVKAYKLSVSVVYRDEPVFSSFYIERQINAALNKKVWLHSGGFLYIEQTEACVVIDVNTGKFIGRKNHEETVIMTNKEAVLVIAHQIQLRNLSGIIIVDFIDIKDESENLKIKELMIAELRKGRVSAGVNWMNESGLMQITRKKTREPIAALLLENCKCCGGTGKVAKNGG